MKVMTFFGTRSEIIKLSLITKVLDQHCDHMTIETGQESRENFTGTFFRDLELRTPNVTLDAGLPGQLFSSIEDVLMQNTPDRVLVLSGASGSVAATAAANKEIPVYCLEAGRRFFDSSRSDESDRRLADQASKVLMACTSRSKSNLLNEGIEPSKIFVTGNPLAETLDSFSAQIEDSPVMTGLKIKPFDYFVSTVHHHENLGETALTQIFAALAAVGEKFGKQILFVAHPRSALKLAEHAVRPSPKVRLLKALNYFDFITLVKNSLGVLTDSGSVQDECSMLRVPSVTFSRFTDRPETLECGSNILSGIEAVDVVRSVDLAIGQPASWNPPAEYSMLNVSQIVSKIVLGYGGSSA